MVETVVRKEICDSCGADVREGSLFCYGCGKSVIAEPESEAVAANDPRYVEESSLAETADKTSIHVAPDRPPANGTGSSDVNSLQTAAGLRKLKREFNRKPVEVVWEQPTGEPRMFVVVTLIVSLFAAVLLWLAFYLR